ncbi:uncharacterized protein LOC136028526 [Artemia franciscana]|uniref:uncharacterized protein LOC136028526 n=1 Tax=Artemia franciscana TaxID=6661 RepID=UPI0032DA7616
MKLKGYCTILALALICGNNEARRSIDNDPYRNSVASTPKTLTELKTERRRSRGQSIDGEMTTVQTIYGQKATETYYRPPSPNANFNKFTGEPLEILGDNKGAVHLYWEYLSAGSRVLRNFIQHLTTDIEREVFLLSMPEFLRCHRPTVNYLKYILVGILGDESVGIYDEFWSIIIEVTEVYIRYILDQESTDAEDRERMEEVFNKKPEFCKNLNHSQTTSTTSSQTVTSSGNNEARRSIDNDPYRNSVASTLKTLTELKTERRHSRGQTIDGEMTTVQTIYGQKATETYYIPPSPNANFNKFTGEPLEIVGDNKGENQSTERQNVYATTTAAATSTFTAVTTAATSTTTYIATTCKAKRLLAESKSNQVMLKTIQN